MEIVLDLNGFTRTQEIPCPPFFKFRYAWIEPLPRLEIIPEEANRIMGVRPEEMKVLEFIFKGKTDNQNRPIYEWDGEGLFWGSRRPHSRR